MKKNYILQIISREVVHIRGKVGMSKVTSHITMRKVESSQSCSEGEVENSQSYNEGKSQM